MKYKIGDVVQIAKTNNGILCPENYINQIVTIVSIHNYKYPYNVEYNSDFKGDKTTKLWSEEELDYLNNDRQVG